MEYLKNRSLETQGIIYMLLCQLFFTANDALIKKLLIVFNNIHILDEIVFVRGIIATSILGLILYVSGDFKFKEIATNTKLHIRGLMEAVTAIFFFIGLYNLPMADVYTLLNLAPILITLSGAIFLAEQVGWRRWTAVILGFTGVVIVINPTNLEFGYSFIFPLISAFFIAYRDTYTRKIKKDFNIMHAAFLTSFAVTVVFGIGTAFNVELIKFTLTQFLIIVLAAIFLIIGYFFSILTIRTTLMSTTSSFRYSTIIWGMLFGYVYFNEVPSLNMIIGATIIVLSGLFIIQREKKIGIRQ
ncbi:MAG: DMT family transporter [Pelagibacteraceae bacterium]